MTQTARQGLGAAGERLARRHLEQQGYTFTTANWRFPGGELDLVMREVGVDEAQGYLFSPAIPSSGIRELLVRPALTAIKVA